MAKAKKKENVTPEERLQAALVPDWAQPYKVPENWCWVRLGAVSTYQYGYTAKAIKNDVYPKMLRITDIQEYGVNWSEVPNCEITQDNLEKYRLFDEDIVIARTGATTGKSFFLNDPCNSVFASYLIRLRVSGSLVPKYVFHFLQTDNYWKQISELSSGIAQPGVNATKLQSLCFPVAPRPEQQRIVDRIESLFTKLDEAKQKVQDALDSFETRKAAILHKVFTGELTVQWRKEHDVGLESWDNNSLGKYLEPLESKKPQGEEFRYIDIDAIDNINQVVREPKRILVKNAPSRANRGLKTNDIIFSMVRPYLKNIAYIDESLSDCIASTGFYVCRCKPDLLPRYLYYFLCSKDAIDYLMQFMKGDNSPSIRKNDLLEMPVSFPIVPEQTEIVRILDDFLYKEQQAKENAEAVLEQIDFIKKSILGRAFRGELSTNDPDEESSIELLKRNFLETIEIEKVKPKQVTKQKTEVVFMRKTIMEVLSKGVRLTPEKLKNETQLSVDDFYAQLKELIDNGSVVESRENGESYLEAVNENRQTKS